MLSVHLIPNWAWWIPRCCRRYKLITSSEIIVFITFAQELVWVTCLLVVFLTAMLVHNYSQLLYSLNGRKLFPVILECTIKKLNIWEVSYSGLHHLWTCFKCEEFLVWISVPLFANVFCQCLQITTICSW